MGLFTEIMTKHSCQGVPLPSNIYFIASCNPYRLATKEDETYEFKIEGFREKRLAYTINPLPFALINFVFNFGGLTPENEKNYINNMIVNPIENFFKENNFNRKYWKEHLSQEDNKLCQELKKLASDAIIKAQNFIREKQDISSVSLREIRRFCIFYEFFVEYFRKIKKLFEEKDKKEFDDYMFRNFYVNLSKKEIYINSIKLSIYLCYYIRLSKKEFRKEFSNMMNRLFGDYFLEVPLHEQEFIAKNIDMKKGIAKNKILLENLSPLLLV